MELLPHQIEDAQFLAERRFAGCFSDMGTGKTLTALEAARLVLSNEAGHGEALLIIAPPIALRMWQREVESYLGWGDAQIIKTGRTNIDRGASAHICSYEIATKRSSELSRLVGGGEGGVLICDESHALKNVTAKRTKAILGKGGIASHAAHAWMLTGTPVTRWNDDLYPFLCRADMAGLKERTGGNSMDRFRLRYCVTQQRQFPGARWPVRMTVGNMNTDELRDWLYKDGLAVRRVLKDVWEAMPPVTVNRYTIGLKMSEELREAMKMISNRSITQVTEMLQSEDSSLSTLRRLIGLAKVPAAADVIAERVTDGYGPVLAGVWHTGVIDALFEALEDKGLTVDVIDGRTSSAGKQRAEDRFNDQQCDVLLGQIASMGVSLNLQQGGNRIMIVEEDWSPSVMDQFYARLYRMGQERHVHIDVLYNENKLEDALARIADTKRAEHARLNEQEEK